ncbi:unnamed protein product [Closterium sp. NIES-64]|nr:unnamed protein product [Closterium sp. NIES-64]
MALWLVAFNAASSCHAQRINPSQAAFLKDSQTAWETRLPGRFLLPSSHHLLPASQPLPSAITFISHLPFILLFPIVAANIAPGRTASIPS